MRGAPMRSPMGDARLYGMPVHGMHAYRRDTPMIGTPMSTPMRWPMGDARLWERAIIVATKVAIQMTGRLPIGRVVGGEVVMGGNR
jgi:hypothetical protein